MKKIVFVLTCFFFLSVISAQNNLNAYKYVIVPKKFDFQKSEDQHQLNSLTKFLFDKEGFKTLFEGNDAPQDLHNNPCLGLKTKVVENSNLFSTKLKIELTNCRNETIFTSTEGKSKIKEFKKGHHDALRKAFESIKAVNYSYNFSLSESIKKEVVVAELVKVSEPIVEEKVEEVIEDKPTEVVEKVETSVKEDSSELLKESTKNNDEKNGKEEPAVFAKYKILYAQGIENGFQFVDSTPQKVFVALKSSTENLFYLKNKAGILYKEEGKWYAEYYRDGKLVKEELNIKF